eukprot:TRINITY_DN32678_c0_g1_i1.p1 TRINITY_DN32678_c0_g1~~TRINITY_DN32678_c0_g1_i1.p1  ORF type:complete len:912 (-),score=265.24 TRINITY_DN32678_c0_g1_i1:134-2569(-)
MPESGGASKPAAAPAKAAAETAPAAKPAAKAAGGTGGYNRAPAAAAKPDAAPRMTLEQLCSGGGSASSAAGRATKPAAKNGGTTGGPPRSLGSLWASEVDSSGLADSAWKTVGTTSELLGQKSEWVNSDSDEDDSAAADTKTSAVRERQKADKEEKRARRLAASAAIVNAKAEQEASEQLDEIALHGLRETREGMDDGARGQGRGTRGAHVEGKGSKHLHLEGVSLKLSGVEGTVELLREADMHLSPGHVYGFVGKNGSGKTTFMRRLAARALPGIPAHLRFGYVAQELGALRPDQTPLEAVVAADLERTALLEEHEDLFAKMSDTSLEPAVQAKHSERFLVVEQELEAIDANGAEERAREMLRNLQFSEKTLEQNMERLSGGWRMRVALASALFGRPDVLFLDEPTNHLDLHGVLWLQEHLKGQWGAESKKKDRLALIVSHDKDFLDSCATDILEIHDCKLRVFPGTYSDYVNRVADEQRSIVKKKEEAEHAEQKARKELAEKKKVARAHKDEKKIRQLKAQEKKTQDKAAKLASSREVGDGAQGGQEDLATKLRQDTSLRFSFPEADIIEDANLLEYDEATIKRGKEAILKKLTLTLDSQSRVAIVGGNGQGKSTLMLALAGELKAEEGSRGRGRQHAGYNVGFVSQDHLERQMKFLHGNCVDYLREQLPDANKVRGAVMTKQSEEPVLRAHLGNFGLGREAMKKVGYLSGGQRARLSLASATWDEPTVLLLDEPTNHLDVDSLDALTLGLQAFDGAVVVVSHNRGFLRALCDELWIVQNGTVKVCPRGEDAFESYFNEYTRSVAATMK